MPLCNLVARVLAIATLAIPLAAMIVLSGCASTHSPAGGRLVPSRESNAGLAAYAACTMAKALATDVLSRTWQEPTARVTFAEQECAFLVPQVRALLEADAASLPNPRESVAEFLTDFMSKSRSQLLKLVQES